MYRATTWIILLGTLCLAVSLDRPVQGGFVSVDVLSPDFSPDGELTSFPVGPGGAPSWVLDILPNGNASATISESFLAGLDDLTLVVEGETDGDPIITVSKDVENNSGFTWTAYSIVLSGGSNEFVLGTATSDKMALGSESALLLEFTTPAAVPDGELVNFTFDINVPTMGSFNFTLDQTPTPEPGSALLLCWTAAGLGALRIRRSRRV